MESHGITRNQWNQWNHTESTESHRIMESAVSPLDQIQSILATERNFVLHSQSPVWPNDRIAEIQHADWYRSIAENEDKSNFITLMLNVDGIAMSGSSDNSL
ncbi:unnamed protein product [Rotaria socialis]|uniref:Uncharacterized protein n=1 Tax=Rotaria socialis TaxID=392032 RepID=A0A821FT35_9BILA|nr:unnamed protein product [Rotaria socialis]CAF4656304.1 unnamed protein product [Rotaria socialis]